MEVIRRIFDKYKLVISDKSLNEFFNLLQCRAYQKGDPILTQGEVSRYMYVVKRGIVRQFYYKDGRDITEHFSCEGDVVTCIESLFQHKATMLCMEAVEASELYLIDYSKWCKLADTNPQINQLLRSILEYKLIVSQHKADSWRFESSHERYQRFCREYPAVAQRASIAHIASYLLMAPETLSRVRAGTL